ncbi:MAG: glycogen debranching N-terminal domain-containing protein [Actinomycetota bacterium]
MAITILEGSNFCISDQNGDFTFTTSGLYAFDTRFLSRLELTINGERPLLLSASRVEYYSAAFYLRNPLSGELVQDAISIARHRFVGEGMQDRVLIQNQSMEKVGFEVAVEFGNDFADIFAVKNFDFALGDPLKALPLPDLAEARYEEAENQFVMEDETFPARTQVIFSERGHVEPHQMRYWIELEPRASWELEIDVVPSLEREEVRAQVAHRRFGEERERVVASLTAWNLRVPKLRSTWDDMDHAYPRSVADLASLRLRGGNGLGNLPAAGMPWFMTVFGRDTLITCLQTLMFGTELAQSALEVLAELQATEDDPSIDAEPGKIVHEIRRGKAAKNWFASYYGTIDATPLYLILLSEVWRWTDDAALARRFKEPAMRALGWIDEWGDRDGDGFIEYGKRSETGLENQSWKDSWDSQRFSDGSLAKAPIAPVEAQGYVYDAKRRMAELAREVWRERELAERLDREADELRERFDQAFWTDARGGYYVLALDGEKRQVDSLCSNVGHLLWSGIVKPDRVDQVVDRLMGPDLWSGWGVRTMSSADAGFNPLSYHNGTVWPHDNSLIAWGLARYARWQEAQRIIRRMLNAAGHFEYQLPEVFAGLPRSETPFPIAYPTAARPQAWAAGAPVLLLQILLGLQPDRRQFHLRSIMPLELPTWVGSVRLTGIRAFDKVWDVRVENAKVQVAEGE